MSQEIIDPTESVKIMISDAIKRLDDLRESENLHFRDLINANDIRYMELFKSSEKSVATAFVASEKAIRDALAAVEKSTASAFVAAEKAVALAEGNAEKWREDAKIWRLNITDRERDLATKTEVSALKERLDRGEGSGTGKKDMWSWIIGGIAVAIAILSFFYKH